MHIQKQQGPSVVRHGWAVAISVLTAVIVTHDAAGRGAHLVRAGDDLQAAIDRAQPGDVIRLQAGATFTGTFVLRNRSATGDQPITIRTDTADSQLPSATDRMTPQHASRLPTITPDDAGPAIRTEPGARHWRLMGLRIVGKGGNDLVLLGDDETQRAYSEVPDDIVLDRVLILGDPARGLKRGIALNSGNTTIRNSYIADVKRAGQETQAIAGWNGPGPYVLENNYLEAAGICVLFGGAEPAIGGLVPTDITVRRNVMTRPIEWRDQPWTVKNLFELKNARHVLVEGNLFENNWLQAQVGFAILFTVRASGPRADWSTVEDVTFQNNLVRHVAAGINIHGYDDGERAQQSHNLVIRNNLFYDVDRRWGGNGTFLMIGNEPADVTVEHNTVIQSGNLITAHGGSQSERRPIRGFRFVNNIGMHNEYGVFGDGEGVGNEAIPVYFPGGEFAGNVIAGGQATRYPPGNRFPSASEVMAQFVNPAEGNFRLRPGSWVLRAGADEGPAGADVDQIFRAMQETGLR
jgi:hypothetical protein